MGDALSVRRLWGAGDVASLRANYPTFSPATHRPHILLRLHRRRASDIMAPLHRVKVPAHRVLAMLCREACNGHPSAAFFWRMGKDTPRRFARRHEGSRGGAPCALVQSTWAGLGHRAHPLSNSSASASHISGTQRQRGADRPTSCEAIPYQNRGRPL